jgi:hypothetical protein
LELAHVVDPPLGSDGSGLELLQHPAVDGSLLGKEVHASAHHVQFLAGHLTLVGGLGHSSGYGSRGRVDSLADSFGHGERACGGDLA